MHLQDIEVGEVYTYFPASQTGADNLHFPAVVEKIGKRMVRVRIFGKDWPDGRVRSVSAKQLMRNLELFKET